MARKKQTQDSRVVGYQRDEEALDATAQREERFERDDLARLMGSGCLRTRAQHAERESFFDYD